MQITLRSTGGAKGCASNLTQETKARLTACHVLNTTCTGEGFATSAPRRIDWTALAARLLPPALIGVAFVVLALEWGRYLIR
jgi:hypothetical protein